MKCLKCGKEFSPKVLPLHYARCEVKEVKKENKKLTYKELQGLYKEKIGKSPVGLKKKDLIKALSEV